MAVNDPKIMFPKEWSGSNILGWALMQVRSALSNSANDTSVDAGEPEGEGRVDHCYEQLSHSRVRDYYLPHKVGPCWRNVSRVIHECKITGEVVFDEEVTDHNRNDFRELWERSCIRKTDSFETGGEGCQIVEAIGPEA